MIFKDNSKTTENKKLLERLKYKYITFLVHKHA